MTGAPDIPPEASGESPQGIAAFLASVVAAAGEMAPPLPSLPCREMAELPPSRRPAAAHELATGQASLCPPGACSLEISP